jgi:hypothetical protein
MATYQTDSRVDDYINSLPNWQQDICRRVRNLVHTADPDVTETIKRTNRPYSTLQGNICALLNLFKAVIANNRAGGWRKVQAGQ